LITDRSPGAPRRFGSPTACLSSTLRISSLWHCGSGISSWCRNWSQRTIDNSIGPLFLCFPLLLEKPLQAAGAATATESIRRGKTRTERHFDFDQCDCGARRRFAVGEFTSALAEINGCEPQPQYVLDRTDAVDALPGPDDQPELDSRKAYTLRITNRGAEIRARSSACLYYVVQTRLHLLDGCWGEFLPEVEIHVPGTRLPRLYDGQPSPRRDGAMGAKISSGSICRMGCGTCCTDSRTAIRCLGR
jgi:hypothetical protein